MKPFHTCYDILSVGFMSKDKSGVSLAKTSKFYPLKNWCFEMITDKVMDPFSHGWLYKWGEIWLNRELGEAFCLCEWGTELFSY